MKSKFQKSIAIALVLVVISCTNTDSSEQPSCVIPPAGEIINNQTNLTVFTQELGLSGVALISDTVQELSLQGLELESLKFFTNWQTVNNFNKILITFNDISTEIDITNIPNSNQIVLTIQRTDNNITANLSEYVVCNDVP